MGVHWNLPRRFFGHTSTVLASIDSGSLEFASDDLRADRDVVLAAVAEDPDYFADASENLRAVRDVVLAALSISRHAA